MRITSDIPKEGQFIVIWEYNLDLWSDTVKYVDGELKIYSAETDEFEDSYRIWEAECIKYVYFIVGD